MNGELLRIMCNGVVEAACAAARAICPVPDADDGVVTATDLANSERMQVLGKSLAVMLPHLVHVDEESDKPPADTIISSPYVLVTDGLDASRNFAGGLPFWAVSAGLLRDGRAFLGAVAVDHGTHFRMWSGGSQSAPEVQVLDLAGSLLARYAPMPTPDWRIARLDCMPSANREVQQNWEVNPGYLGFNPWGACARISMLAHVPALGGARAGGALDRSRLWDWAGLWAAFRGLGIEPYNLRTGSPLRTLEPHTLEPGGWRLADDHVWATGENFEFLRARVLKRRSGSDRSGNQPQPEQGVEHHGGGEWHLRDA
jgi:hypothetical protein